jgi:hypothetical protein
MRRRVVVLVVSMLVALSSFSGVAVIVAYGSPAGEGFVPSLSSASG